MPMPQDVDCDCEMSETAWARADLARQVRELRTALDHQLAISAAERKARIAAENSAALAWRLVAR